MCAYSASTSVFARRRRVQRTGCFDSSDQNVHVRHSLHRTKLYFEPSVTQDLEIYQAYKRLSNCTM